MRRQRGAALLMAAMIMLLAVGIPLLLKVLQASEIKTALIGETTRKVLATDEALAAFALTYRRLPCPANGAVASGTAGAGVEARNGNGDCTSQATGVVPWVSLGLAESSVTDGWGGRLTYRVPDGGLGLTRDGALDASACDPAGSNPTLTPSGAATAVACSNACVSLAMAGLPGPQNPTCNAPALFLANRGLTVRDGSGIAFRDPGAYTGAAYVVIGHGAEGGRAFSSSGTVLATHVPAGANGEVRNLNDQSLPGAGFYHPNAIQTGSDAGAAHFDDALSHPTIAELLTRTALGARSR